MQRWRVPLGFACAALFFLLAQSRPWTLVVGGLIALPGLALRAWATGHLRKNDALATTGPYAYTRNPLYLGSLVIGLGFTIAAGRLILKVVPEGEVVKSIRVQLEPVASHAPETLPVRPTDDRRDHTDERDDTCAAGDRKSDGPAVR